MNKRKKKKRQYNPKGNKKYKDRIFRLSFSKKKDLLDLYNAVNHTDYQNVNDLKVNTLDDAVFLSMKNDISFLIGGTMNLYEHQSTWNPNMPFRGLCYLARLYEKYVAEHQLNIYGTKLQKLPSPRYLIFYNGTMEEPDEMTLRLSDAFDEKQGTCLECVATMLNINYGHNRELMEKCRRLEEYALFVQTVRRHVQEKEEFDVAAKEAVDECIEKGILKDILIGHRAEVISMILSCDEKTYKKVLKKEAKEEEAERINLLNQKLFEDKRLEDLERSVNDREFQKQLMEEYGIKDEKEEVGFWGV